jgi:ABC-type transport system substrate-binding protein
VREAVGYAIDRPTVAKAVGYGYWEPLNQVSPSRYFGYNPDYTRRPYNPAKAKQLLAEASYPNGFKTKVIVGPMATHRDAALTGLPENGRNRCRVGALQLGKADKLQL